MADHPLGDHIDEELFEEYAFGRASAAEAARIEEHLLVCTICQQQLREVEQFIGALRRAAAQLKQDPVDFVHQTEGGRVHLLTKQSGDHLWSALISGQQLPGASDLATVEEANEYVLRLFAEMFPEHRCTDQCGPFNRDVPDRAD